MSTQNERSAKAQIIWNSTDSNSITPTMVGSLFYDINVEKLERDNSNAVYQTYDASYTKVAAINPATKKMTLIDIPSGSGTTNFNYIQLDTTSINTYDVGKFYWNETKGTYDFGLKNNVTLQLGQEQNVYGKAYSAITNGQLVMYRTSQGGHILFEPANFTQLSTNPDLIIGVATQDIALNDFGYITTFGEVNTLNTSSFVDGDTLYFGSGNVLQNTIPSGSYFIIGRVNRAHATQGSIFVKPYFVDSTKINGSGTENYVSKFTSSGTIANSIVYDNGTNLGVGTTSPAYKFDLNSNAGGISFKTYTSTTNNIEHTYSKDAGFFIDSYQSVGGYPYTKTTDLIANADAGANSQLRLFTASNGENPAERMRITSDGNVGMSTDSPSEKLDVNGYTKAFGFKVAGGTATQSLTANGGTFDLNTKADLVEGKVPSSQLPSYVDDVLEFANLASFPATGESGKIYIAIDTNITYRWTGTSYAEISASLALGETASTAYRGDRGKIAYDHSQTTGNPHNTTKSDIGLGNVDNTSDLNKPISNATQTALDGKLDKGTYNGTAQDLKNSIDGIEIGGRNLFRMGMLGRILSGIWSSKTDNLSIEGNKITVVSNPMDVFATTFHVKGRDITISGRTNIPIMKAFINPYNSAGFKGAESVITTQMDGENFLLTYTLPEGTVRVDLGLGFYPFSTYGTYWVDDVKVEQGNKATDWTPAPEDKQDRLQDITGNVGLGKSDTIATEKLDVNGNVKATSFIKSGGTSSQYLMADGTVSTLTNPITGTGTTNYIPKFTASGTVGNSIVYDDGTNVGVGAESTSARLDVRAQGALSTDIAFRVRNSTDTQNFLVVNGAGDVYNRGAQGVASNTFFGEGVGRSVTGNDNSAFGLNALYLNTTGANNSAFGRNALYSNTTGNYNNAFGLNVLYSNTTGANNSAFGISALESNTTGANNSAFGRNALYLNTTGNNNSALGVDAGRYTNSGANNEISNTSVFIGYDTRANASNETNQIVIGSTAIGNGSNSVTLGNDSITKTILKGNVGIGTTSPGAPLDVYGSLGSGKSIIRVTNSDTGNYVTIGAGIPGVTNAGMNLTLDGTSKMVISAGGNVGIGTTLPDIFSRGYDTVLGVHGSGITKMQLNGSTYSGIDFGQSGIRYGEINSSSTSFDLGAVGSIPLNLNVNGIYRMTITPSGDVGIGTTSPTAKLDVNGNFRATGNINILYSNKIVGYDDEDNYYISNYAINDYVGLDIHWYGGIKFGVRDGDALHILNNKNIGIGTTSPATLLDVNHYATFLANTGNRLKIWDGTDNIPTITADSLLEIDSPSIRFDATDVIDSHYTSIYLKLKTVNGNVTIDDSYHNKIVRITASCTITIPAGLRIDFNCTFEVIGAYTAQFVDGSGATTSAPFGRYLKTDLTAMFYCTGTASNYRLNGSLTTS